VKPSLLTWSLLAGVALLTVGHFSEGNGVEEAVGQEGSVAPAKPLPAVSPAPPLAPGETAAPAASSAAGPDPARPVVDESALRYYARQGDAVRLQTEIARLKALYPDWTPPTDPLATPSVVDEKLDAIWKLVGEGKVAAARKAVADRQAADPKWQPPADLLDRLATAEAREQIVNASDLGQYETVIRVSATAPSLLTCDDLDVMWRVAEAFGRTDRADRAEDAYRYVLQNCGKGPDRLATVQKAIGVLPRERVETLVTLAREGAPAGEFDVIEDDLARQAVAEGGEKADVKVSPADLKRVEELAEKESKPSDALMLGWYYILREEDADAAAWFGKSRDLEDSAQASQGLALALVAQNKPAEAEDVLYKWRDESDETRATYMAAVANMLAISPPLDLDEARLGRLAAAVGAMKDAAAAQQFGWYADALNQFETARQWFTAALGWKADDEPSAYGLTLMNWKLGHAPQVAEMQRLWAGRSERIATVGKPQPEDGRPAPALPAPPPAASAAAAAAQAAPLAPDRMETAAVPRREARLRRAEPVPARMEAPRGCVATVDPQTLSPDAALRRGWCLMERNRPLEAAEAFKVGRRANAAASRDDAAYGESLAYLRVGLGDRAAVAAASPDLGAKRSREVRAALLASQAQGALEAKRFGDTIFALDQRARIAPERTDLMVLRGYAYLGLQRTDDARRLFEAAAATGDREGRRGLGALASQASSR
jgi:cellulose synthase operon protein C